MTVTIVIPTYNRAAWVGQAIRSVLEQTVVDLELIVVDDGSTDDTASVIGALPADGRLRYVQQENRGRSEARNHGLQLAKGEFVGFLDSDDQLLPDALATQLAAFALQPEAGMTVAGYRVVGDQGHALGEFRPWEWADRNDLQGWLFNCFGMPGSVLHRRTWMERIGGFDRTCEIAEDWDLYLRLAATGCQTAWNRAIVCVYHRHEGSSIRDIERHYRGAVQALARFQTRMDVVDSTLLTRAQAWNEIVFAKRAIEAGLADRAIASISRAVARDPELIDRDRMKTIEFWLSTPLSKSDSTGWSSSHRQVIEHALGATPRELRLAQSRVEMGRFFRQQGPSGSNEAIYSLLRGVLADPRWLLNRGVLVAAARQLRLLPGRRHDPAR